MILPLIFVFSCMRRLQYIIDDSDGFLSNIPLMVSSAFVIPLQGFTLKV